MCGYLLYSSHFLAFSPLFSALYIKRETWILIRKHTFVALISHINQQLVTSDKSWQYFHDPCPQLTPFQWHPCWDGFFPGFLLTGSRVTNLEGTKPQNASPKAFVWPSSDTLQKPLLAFHVCYHLLQYHLRGRRKFLRLSFRNS